MKRRISALLVWVMLWGLILPALASTAYANETDIGQTVFESVYENVYKEVKLTPAADAHIQRGAGGANFGSSEVLTVRWANSSSGENRNAYLKFDLSGLDRLGDHTILGAKVRLYLYDTTVSPYVVTKRVGSNWTEDAITWNSMVAAGGNAAAAEGNNDANAPDGIRRNLDLRGILPAGQVGDWIEFDLRQQFITDFNAGNPVFTVELTEHSVAAGILNFSSREGEFPPELILDMVGPELESVSIASPPDKTVYSVGESLDLTGLVVSGLYADGVSLPLTDYTVSGFDSSNVADSQLITVTAEGKTTQFPVRIVKIKDTELTAVADSFVLQSNQTGNWGTANYMTLKRDNYGSSTRKIYVKYDLSDVNVTDPEDVISAVVQLHRSGGQAGGVGVHSVSDNSWQESEIAWGNAPEHSVAALSATSVGAENQYYSFDITDYVQSQLHAGALSLAFVGQDHNVQINFDSREAAGYEPKLVLTAIEPELESIEIVSPPSRALYYVGQELNLSGLVVKGNYENGTSLLLTDYVVSGFDSSAAAEAQMITIQAGGKTAVFTVEIQQSSGVNPPVWPEGSALTASGTSKTKTSLSWTPALDDTEISGYRLWSGGNLAAELDGEALSYAVTGLAPETHYTFRIEAGDNEGNWTAGPELSVYTMPAPPALPQAISIAGGQFNMEDWTVKVNSDGNGVWQIVDGNLALTGYASQGSEPLRNVIVYETPFIGDFTWTGKVAVTPRGDWDDLAVIFNYIDERNYSFVSLNKSNDDNTHGIFTVVNNALAQLKDFELGIMTSGTVHDLRIDRTGSLIQVFLDDDIIGQAAESLNTTGRFGYGSANDRVALSEMKVYGTELIDLEPPAAPGRLLALVQSSTAIRLSWEASTDDSGIKSYSVYRDGQLLGTTNLTAYVDEGLSPFTEYTYYVVARDVADKDSPPSSTAAAATLEQDSHAFPFSHRSIDDALKEPLLQYTLGTEWAWYSKRSSAALMYLATAALYDSYYAGSDGTLIKDRILAHIRHMLVSNSGREPGASGSLDTAGTAMAIQALDMASTIPAVWSGLTEAEKHKITLIMQAHLVAAHWGHDDNNDFNTGINQGGNFNKGWNPNYVEGAIGIALATARYLGGADAANAFLASFDYNSFMSQLQAAGLSSIAWTFSQTGRIALEASIKNDNGSFNGFTFKGYGLNEPFQWMKARGLIMYNKPVKAEVYEGGTRRGYVANNPEGLPNLGAMGMAQEFDSIDADGLRTDLGYAADGWNNSLISLLTTYYYDETGSSSDMELIQSRYEVGATDLIYKATNGYIGYAKGKAIALRNAATIDANMGYYWLKELWENVISRPELIPHPDATPPTAPGNVAGQLAGGSLHLSWDASTDNNQVAGYRIYQNGEEIGHTGAAIAQYVVGAAPVAGDIYTVKAYDAVGNLSDFSGPALIDEEPVVVDTPPEWPQGSALTADSLTRTGAVLNWTAAEDDEGVAAYRVYKDGVLLDTVAGSVRRYEVTGLTASTAYVFRVEAGDAADQWTTDGPQTEATTLDEEPVVVDTPPEWPQGSALTADSLTRTGAVLNWTAAEDDRGVTAYRVYKDGVLLDTVAGSVYRYEVTGLTASTAYAFKVEAGDAADQWTTDGPQVQIRTLQSGGYIATPATPATLAPAPVPTKPKATAAAGEDSIALEINVDKNKATAVVKLEGAGLDKFLQAGAGATGSSPLKISLPQLEGITSYVLQVPGSYLKADAGDNGVLLDTPYAAVTLSSQLLRGLADSGGGQGDDIAVTVGQADKSKLPPSVQEALGNRPLLQLAASVAGKSVKDIGETPLVVAIPYTPSTEELARHEHLVIWTISETGSAEPVFNGKYDPATGTVTFTTTGFGQYGIAFVEKTFADIKEAEWSRQAVEVLASKGIIDGTSPDTYSPSASISRADFVALLVKTLGLKGSVDSSFDDVSPRDHHYRELSLAKTLGIAQGSGSNRFDPQAVISRQDMMVLTARALEIARKLELKSGGSAGMLASFTDEAELAGYAREGAASLVSEGLIQGSGEMINPLGSTTRAEAAMLLYRIFVKY
ncbi:MAG: Carbohydrate-binding family 9 [Paenibacillaceae bacterium]|jgi:chitodextrinase|nr:Carbohydrate-binding family 9 [Paenibacillaceae bacterium]